MTPSHDEVHEIETSFIQKFRLAKDFDPQVRPAYYLAEFVHREEKYGDRPYIVHPAAVAALAHGWMSYYAPMDTSVDRTLHAHRPLVLQACLLHDALETEDVGSYIGAVGDIRLLLACEFCCNVKGRSRRETHELTIAKQMNLVGDFHDLHEHNALARYGILYGAIAKLFDRLANTRRRPDRKMADVYRREHTAFASVMRPLGAHSELVPLILSRIEHELSHDD